MKSLMGWLDQRTGCNKLLHEALYENVPGGARWRYVWGSALLSCFATQVITGIFLWMAYSPSSQTAWESVYYIQHRMWGGWFLRGLHHYTAQAMTALLALHMMQVIVDGAYKAPREVNFWSGLALMGLVLSLSLTGYLLPWDQKGYWATKVATNIAAITPIIGPGLQRVLIGGADYGHHTLTRFFAFHAGVVPGAIAAFIAIHLYVFRRHGVAAKEPKRRPDAPFWPDQLLKDLVVCLAVLAAAGLITVRTHGADLAAPADPSEPFSAARPEWYFLFLFQFLKYFPSGTEVWGAIVIPGFLAAFMAAMPFMGRWKLGHRFNIAFLFSLLFAAGALSAAAIREDRHNPSYRAAVKAAEKAAARTIELANSPMGIPPAGAVVLLREDPLTQGPKLFARHCASCHRYEDSDGLGGQPKDSPSGADLGGFASREWLAGLLDPKRVDGPHYYGGTKFEKGKMARFVKKDVAGLDADQKAQLQKVIAAVSAEASLKSQAAADHADRDIIAQGRALFSNDTMRCGECHAFHKTDADLTAPDMTGYGSRDWLIKFVANPAHSSFYGKRNDRMPAFGENKTLDEKSIELIADWLRGDWYSESR